MDITIKKAGERYELAFPYSHHLVDAVRRLPERRWEKSKRVWSVPRSTARQLDQWIDSIKSIHKDINVVMDHDIRCEIQAVVEYQEASIEASKASNTNIEIPIPEGLAYLPYQRAGIHYAMQRPSTLLGDQMGLGKTVQAIGFSNVLPEIKSVLVICPASLKLNWAREWKKWDTKSMNIGVVTSGSGYLPYTQVVIINYDQLKKHIAGIHRREWDLLIADEAHYMKSYKALRTLYVLGGQRKVKNQPPERFEPIRATRKLFLTGTPISNRPMEIWPLAHALAPDSFNSWARFAYRYCAASQGSYGLEIKGASNLDELQDRLRATIMVRRLKEDVLKELPAKRRQVIELDCELLVVEREKAAYSASRLRLEALKLAVELAKGGTEAEYKMAVDTLRAGISGEFSEMAKLRHETALAKVPLVVEHLKDATDGSKVVCFAHHKDVVKAILDEFPGISVSITGDTPMQARQDSVDRFQTDPACLLFVGNLQVAGVGITLTAASHVVFAELDWVPGNLSQAEDRCHRIGQKDSVLVQHLVLAESLDATMAKRVVEKQRVIDAALDNDYELKMEPLLPMMPAEAPATESSSRKQIEKDALKLTSMEIEAIHAGLKRLSALCDGASSIDGMGFNKMDTAIGHSLANCVSLSPKQAALGKRLVTKYRRQLHDHA